MITQDNLQEIADAVSAALTQALVDTGCHDDPAAFTMMVIDRAAHGLGKLKSGEQAAAFLRKVASHLDTCIDVPHDTVIEPANHTKH